MFDRQLIVLTARGGERSCSQKDPAAHVDILVWEIVAIVPSSLRFSRKEPELSSPNNYFPGEGGMKVVLSSVLHRINFGLA